MNPDGLLIRPVFPEDNPMLASLIREVLVELGAPRVGTAYADSAVDRMYETYQAPRSAYWVVANDSGVLGGGGIAPLEGAESSICELQKMYFKSVLRGKGWGDRLITRALEEAARLGFKKCYLETMPYMEAAQKLYQRHGFRYRDRPLGQTGHTSCTVWMEKELS
jgi:putative acetyltransferase